MLLQEIERTVLSIQGLTRGIPVDIPHLINTLSVSNLVSIL